MRTVFFGTPSVAVPFLERLAKKTSLMGVVTSPDRPAGRGQSVVEPEVKKTALRLGCPVRQPEHLRDFSLSSAFGGGADVGLVVAYGHLIPPAVFQEPVHGLVNVHFSMLPRYRGAGPMQWALIRGEQETGVSLFRIEKGLDTGPVYLQKSCPIAGTDNASTLKEKLVKVGLDLLEEFLHRLGEGPWVPTPQVGEASLAPPLTKEDGNVRWSTRSARDIANIVRGTYEWPGAFARIKGHRLKIRRAEVASGFEISPQTQPGTVVAVDRGRGFLVQCFQGGLWLARVQPEGKKEMDAADFWNGARLRVGDQFEVNE